MKAYIVSRTYARGGIETLLAVNKAGMMMNISRKNGKTSSVVVERSYNPDAIKLAIKSSKHSVVFLAAHMASKPEGWDKVLAPQDKSVVITLIDTSAEAED